MKTAFILFLILMLSSFSYAACAQQIATLPECDEKEISPNFTSKIMEIREASLQWNGHIIAKKEAAELRANHNLSCLENALIDLTIKLAATRSQDLDEAVSASNFFLDHPYLTDANHRAEIIQNALPRYLKKQDFARILALVDSDFHDASDQLKSQLIISKIHALIGTGETTKAYRISISWLEKKGADARPSAWRIAIALAERLGDSEAMAAIEAKALESVDDLRWPAPLHGIEGDRLEHLFQRATNPVYHLIALEPIIIEYPASAGRRGMKGMCNYFFDVTAKGKPENVEADCTHIALQNASIKALKKTRFKPIVLEGKARPVVDVEHAIEYNITR